MLPSLLTSRLKTILSSDYEGVLEAFSHERRWSFRLNELKTDWKDVFDEFEQKWIIIESFVWIPGVFVFDRVHEFAIKWTRAFYDGKIYLQGIASILPVLALDVQWGDQVLDICAAPGSKTTQMAMLMKNEWKIVALEQNQIRFDKLMHNIKLQWATIVEWVKIDATLFFARPSGILFDRILLDAPCSAEGRILLSNEKSYGFWSLENTKKKAELQYKLLLNSFSRLKVGGVLVYSTCTLAPEENEWVISRFLTDYPVARLESIDVGLSHASWWKNGLLSFGKSEYGEKLKNAVRILPSSETEGFFVVKISKH